MDTCLCTNVKACVLSRKVKHDFMSKLSTENRLNFAEFDSFSMVKDLMVQLKAGTRKQDLVFVKFETSENNLYDYLVKKQNIFDPLKSYVKLSCASDKSRLYLYPLRNKREPYDKVLKQAFNVRVERDKDLVLGILVPERVKLECDDFNKLSTYDLVHKLFELIVQDKSYMNTHLTQKLVVALSNADKLGLLTDAERLELKAKFWDKLPGPTLIVLSSSPNKLYKEDALVPNSASDSTSSRGYLPLTKLQEKRFDELIGEAELMRRKLSARRARFLADDLR